MAIVFECLIILVTLGVTGVFVAYEMALASVARARLYVLESRKLFERLKSDIKRQFLTSIFLHLDNKGLLE